MYIYYIYYNIYIYIYIYPIKQEKDPNQMQNNDKQLEAKIEQPK